MSSRYILAFLKSPGFHLTDQFSFALLAAFNCRIALNAFEGSAIVSYPALLTVLKGRERCRHRFTASSLNGGLLSTVTRIVFY